MNALVQITKNKDTLPHAHEFSSTNQQRHTTTRTRML